MELRKEIEPQFDVAENRYPEVLKSILVYTDYCEKNGDEENIEYKKLEEKLHLMTGKEMSKFNLWEWWEEEGAENLAFDISLPDPQKVNSLTKEEVYEIVRRLKTFEEINTKHVSDFFSRFYQNTVYGNGYFMKFLEINFNKFRLNLFQRNKDKDGNYFEYSIDEVIAILIE
ncbi:hypothetical protein [Flavobacterium sp. CSZ]|uniref:hypothetical protein n=1 Tax=Flavobacterium sp. CSZ TaxID=2783791 RepID=UPI001889CB24|nr:hypothetical protein [Flavobacterium sp. CSZ]MBF4484934.1 hypothetical protein [Flavobacterium sp. CSZ]